MKKYTVFWRNQIMFWKMSKNSVLTDVNYEEYYLKGREMVKFAFLCLAGCLGFSFVFYNSFLPGEVVFLPLIFFLTRREADQRKEKRKNELNRQFLTAVRILGDYLRAGYSVENAVYGSVGELTLLYGEGGDIVREWKSIGAKMSLNQTAEEAFLDFGERAHMEQLHNFAEVFAIVKRSGGRLGEVVSSVAEVLTEQFSVEEQIRTAMAARQLEQKIMDVMPLSILLYIRTTSYEMVEVMYSELIGRLVMTGCLAIYLAAYLWSEMILKPVV